MSWDISPKFLLRSTKENKATGEKEKPFWADFDYTRSFSTDDEWAVRKMILDMPLAFSLTAGVGKHYIVVNPSDLPSEIKELVIEAQTGVENIRIDPKTKKWSIKERRPRKYLRRNQNTPSGVIVGARGVV